MMKKIWLLYRDQPYDRKILLAAASLALVPVLATLMWSGSSSPEPVARAAAQVDTFIPKGFVLVPIDVQNYEALDSILGRFALVDLYQGGAPGTVEQRLVARNVRLLRAPQNPSHFAILVAEDEAGQILKFGSTFTVIMKRMENVGTQFVKSQAKTHRSIVYDGEAQ